MTDEQKTKRAQQAVTRRAMDKATKEAWKERVDAHFAYLRTKYQFHIAKMENFWYVTRVVYCSSTTLINIDRSVEFDRVEVSVARTENNVVSKDSLSNPLMIGPQTHLLDGILAIRAPDLRKAVPSIKGLAEEQIETALAFWASTLNTYAEDVLQGSFAIFAELSAKYKTE